MVLAISESPTTAASPEPTPVMLDVSRMPDERLIQSIAAIKAQMEDMRNDLAVYGGEMLKRMRANEAKKFPHPSYTIERKTTMKYTMSDEDALAFILAARAIKIPNAEIEKAISVQESEITYSTKYPSIMVLVKNYGGALKDIADRIDSSEDGESLVFKPR